MKVRYKPDTDTAYIALVEEAVANGDVYESDEVAPSVVVDFDHDDRPVGIEIYDDARRKLAGIPLWESDEERALEIGRAWIAGYRAALTDRDAESQTREARQG